MNSKVIDAKDIIEIKSNKGKWKNIFYDGHKFVHQREANSAHYYVCAKYFDRKCSCRMVKKNETDYTLRGEHCHPADPNDRHRVESWFKYQMISPLVELQGII